MELKINVLLPTIEASLRANEVTIISTSTGSGKTMAVPALCQQLSGNKTFCLAPRVIMCRQAQVGANSLIFKDNHSAGIMTGRGDSRGSKVVYATEGSFLARHIIKDLVAGDYLVVDEVHEQGALTSAILYMAMGWIREKGVKLVLLSATLDVPKYAAYFSDFSVGIINEPQSPRPYKMDFCTVEDPTLACAMAAKNGGRVLVGVAGKGDIDNFMYEVMKLDKTIKVFPVHGELEVEDMDAAVNYEGGCIYVATNILQSGVTIPYLTHGYFQGTGKRMENVNGISKLTEYFLSKAEMTQWFGRIGRNCDGFIFQTSYDVSSWARRPEMPTAEILLSPLLDIYLDFLRYDINMEDAVLIDMPPSKAIKDAKNALEKLRLLKNGRLTKLGTAVVERGLGVRGGIMLHLGELLGVENTMQKIQTIDYIGHPFRYASLRSNASNNYSDYAVWIDEIEKYISKYGYNIVEADQELFLKECEEKGVFRRNLKRLMKAFKAIDETVVDNNPNPKYVKAAIYYANLDRLVIHGWLDDEYYIRTAKKCTVEMKAITFGNIISLPSSTFIEGTTTITKDEMAEFDLALS